MTTMSVVGVFMLAGILFPIVLVPVALVLDGIIASAMVLWWSWTHAHEYWTHHHVQAAGHPRRG